MSSHIITNSTCSGTGTGTGSRSGTSTASLILARIGFFAGSLTASSSVPDATQVNADRLRVISSRRLLRSYSNLLKSNEGSEKTFELSHRAQFIGCFISHSWRTPGWLKSIALMYRFNIRRAIFFASLTHIIVLSLALAFESFPIPPIAPGYVFGGTTKHSLNWQLHYVPACIVLFVVFRYGGELNCVLPCVDQMETFCFLDKCCIPQTDEEEKRATIQQLGGFLRNSQLMCVLWNEEYFTRLWCVYEVAAFIHIHRDPERIIFMPLKSYCCTMSLCVFHCVASVSFTILAPLLPFSAWQASWTVEHIAAKAQYFWAWCWFFVMMVFGLYLIPCFGLWWFAKRHMQDRKKLLRHLETFKISEAKCLLENDRVFVEKQIKRWFRGVSNFEDYIHNDVYKVISNTLDNQGPLPIHMVLLGSLSHVYILTTEMLLAYQADETDLMWRILLSCILLSAVTDPIAMSVVLRMADRTQWPTIFDEGGKFQKCKGPVISAVVFGFVNASSVAIVIPSFDWGFALALSAVLLICTWLLYGGLGILRKYSGRQEEDTVQEQGTAVSRLAPPSDDDLMRIPSEDITDDLMPTSLEDSAEHSMDAQQLGRPLSSATNSEALIRIIEVSCVSGDSRSVRSQGISIADAEIKYVEGDSDYNIDVEFCDGGIFITTEL